MGLSREYGFTVKMHGKNMGIRGIAKIISRILFYFLYEGISIRLGLVLGLS